MVMLSPSHHIASEKHHQESPSHKKSEEFLDESSALKTFEMHQKEVTFN